MRSFLSPRSLSSLLLFFSSFLVEFVHLSLFSITTTTKQQINNINKLALMKMNMTMKMTMMNATERSLEVRGLFNVRTRMMMVVSMFLLLVNPAMSQPAISNIVRTALGEIQGSQDATTGLFFFYKGFLGVLTLSYFDDEKVRSCFLVSRTPLLQSDPFVGWHQVQLNDGAGSTTVRILFIATTTFHREIDRVNEETLTFAHHSIFVLLHSYLLP